METKNVIDLASVGVTIATIADWLPTIAAALSIIWLTMRIGETLYRWYKRGIEY